MRGQKRMAVELQARQIGVGKQDKSRRAGKYNQQQQDGGRLNGGWRVTVALKQG